MTGISVVDPDTGHLTHVEASTLRSVTDGAGVVRCHVCNAAGALVRREGEGSLLPVAHHSSCPVLDLEHLLLHQAYEEFQHQAAQAGPPPSEGADLMVVSLHTIYPEEVALLAAFGHAADRTAQVRTITTDTERRRVYTLTDGQVIW